MFKIGIIEDHDELREGFSILLNTTENFTCDKCFSSLEEGIDNLNNLDLLLLDIGLPGMTGIEGIPIIKEKYPDLKIIMLTVFDDNNNVFRAILSGANGYLLKKTPPKKLLQAIEDAVSGGTPMTPAIATKVITLFKKFVPAQRNDFDLSIREKQVLNLVIDGFDNSTIAEKLFISKETVRNHIRHIYQKLHVHSKSQAVVKAIREGII